MIKFIGLICDLKLVLVLGSCRCFKSSNISSLLFLCFINHYHFTLHYPKPLTSWIHHSFHLIQSSAQRQIPRASAHIHSLGIRTNNPVLRHGIPVRDISPGDLIREGLRLSGVEDQVIEAAEDDLWVGGAAEGDVLEGC